MGKNDIVENLSKSVASVDPDGVMRFDLEIWPYSGDTRRYQVDQYAELVARTTTAEATQTAFIQKAQNLRTRLVKYNFIGKDYNKLGDKKCAAIDGKIFVIDKGSGTVKGGRSGIEYESFDKSLGSILGFGGARPDFLLPHPNCNHIARPFPEVLA
jgi:hypothetical protein